LWKELIRLPYVELQLTSTVLAQMCTGVLFIRLVSDATFANTFLPDRHVGTIWRTVVDHRWSADHSLVNTALCRIGLCAEKTEY
jgi:hypothetical protein